MKSDQASSPTKVSKQTNFRVSQIKTHALPSISLQQLDNLLPPLRIKMDSDKKEQIAPKDQLNPEKVQPAAGRKKKHFIPLGKRTSSRISV